jgi:hypothetical protein
MCAATLETRWAVPPRFVLEVIVGNTPMTVFKMSDWWRCNATGFRHRTLLLLLWCRTQRALLLLLLWCRTLLLLWRRAQPSLLWRCALLLRMLIVVIFAMIGRCG